MATAKKYLFDVSFDQAASKSVVVPQPEPEETFSRAELEAAQQAARAEGHSAGLAEANDAATARAAGAIETLAKGVTSLFVARDATAVETQRQAIAALRVIVAKTVPVLAAKGALAEIEALATKCLIEAVDEPRVVLRVSNDVYEAVRGQLDAMAAASGYAGRIVLLADEMLVASDARVEWADGGVERNLAQQLNEIDATLARSCDPAATPNPTSSSGDEV
jgi:flagellar assembly protein FliH